MAITDFNDIAGLIRHFDTKDLSTVSKTGANILTQLNCKTGNGEDITEITGDVTHGVETYNNHPVIDLPLTTEMRSLIYGSRDHAKTIFLLAGRESNIDNTYMVFHGNSFASTYVNVSSTGGGKLSVSSQNLNFSGGEIPIDTTLWTITQGAADISMQLDAAPAVVTSYDGNTGVDDGVVINRNGNNHLWFGLYLMYDSELSPSDIQDVQDLIALEWLDTAVYAAFCPPTIWDEIEMATTTVPPDSIVYGDTFAVGDQVAFETIANHSLGSTGTVVLDEFAVPTITGTSDAGDWTFSYKIKDANGVNSATYLVTITVT